MIAVAFATLMGVGGWISISSHQHEEGLTDLQLSNAEALTTGENTGYGCGMAAYEWDNDWYEDTKNFAKCRSGCPEGSGTSPKYMNC